MLSGVGMRMGLRIPRLRVLEVRWSRVMLLFAGGCFFAGYTLAFLDYGDSGVYYFPARLSYHLALGFEFHVGSLIIDSIRDAMVAYMASLLGMFVCVSAVGAMGFVSFCAGSGLPVVLEYGSLGVIGFYSACCLVDLCMLCLVSSSSLSIFSKVLCLFRRERPGVEAWEIDFILYSLPLLLLSLLLRVVAARWVL